MIESLANIIFNEPSNKNIYWACRRGMYELDLILAPFYQDKFASLNQWVKTSFIKLLETEDVALHSWLIGRELPETNYLKPIVFLLRDYAIDPHRSREI